MKNYILLMLAQAIYLVSFGQFNENGYKFYKIPRSNVFDFLYLKPVKNKDPKTLGNSGVTDSQIKVSNSADNGIFNIVRGLDLEITSLVKYNSALNYTVIPYNLQIHTLNLSQTTLRKKIYYCYEAITADSFDISVTRKSDVSGNSSDAEKAIMAYVTGNTAAFKFIDALNPDKTEEQAIVKYRSQKGDSIVFRCRKKGIYFASRFIMPYNDYTPAQFPSVSRIDMDKIISFKDDMPVNNYFLLMKGLRGDTDYSVYADLTAGKLSWFLIVNSSDFIDTVNLGSATKKSRYTGSYTYDAKESQVSSNKLSNTLIEVDWDFEFYPDDQKLKLFGYGQIGNGSDFSAYRNCILDLEQGLKVYPK